MKMRDTQNVPYLAYPPLFLLALGFGLAMNWAFRETLNNRAWKRRKAGWRA